MMSPFRALSLRSSHGSKGSGNQVVVCPRHPRSWIEKRVFFVTTTRVCPYCDLESYAVVEGSKEGKPAPCEAGFGGFAPVEKRRPSKTAQRPGGRGRGRGGGGGGGRGGAREGTPRAGGGVENPRARGAAPGSTPRTATVRRTAVFKPTTQPTPRGDGRPPRGSPPRQRGDSSSYSVKGAPRPKHKRSASSTSSSSSLAGTPKAAAKAGEKAETSPSHRLGGSGGSGGSGRRRPPGAGKAPPSPSGEGEGEGGGGGGGGAGGDADPGLGTPVTGAPPPHPAVEATPKRAARSLMFTSAARKRGGRGRSGGGGNNVNGSISGSGVFDDASVATPASYRDRGGVEPPSPSGSLFSDFSATGGVFGSTAGGGGAASGSGNRGPPPSRGSGPVMLTLPESLQDGGGDGGVDGGCGGSGIGTPGANFPPSPISRLAAASLAGDALHTARGESSTGTAPAGGLVPAVEAAAPGKLSSSPAAAMASASSAASSRDDAWRLAAAVMAAVERAEPQEARERARPAAAVVVRLAAVLKALRPERVGESSRADDVLDKAALASGVVEEVGVLAMEEGGDGGSAEGPMDEEAVEAAGAILSEAGHAVDSLAQTARAFAWSGREVSELSGCAAFVTRYRKATVAVLEAARRAGLFLASLATTAPGKGPRDKAEAQRLWLSVLDRHEAWMRRRDSRKGLLMAEQEIPAGTVTIFRDCPLLPEGAFGETCAAEYLGIPVSATILVRPSSSPLASGVASDALGKPSTTTAAAAAADAAAATLRATATSEMRTLASLVPLHPRLARLHGIETIPPRGVVASSPRAVKGGKEEGGGGGGSGKGGVGAVAAAEAPVLVLVGDVVDGGTLRDRVAARAAAVVRGGKEGGGEEGGIAGAGGDALGGGGGGGGGACAKEKDGAVAEDGARDDGDAEDGATGDGDRETPARVLLRRRRVLADIAEGLAFLHERGVWHGALSAKNVLLDAEGRAKLSLFGLPETRKAVGAWRGASIVVASATVAPPASTPSDSAEGDTCVQAAPGATATPPSRSCVRPPSVWTPPEALAAAATPAVAMAHPPEEGNAAVEAERKRVGIAADAYAFGMIAWEVHTGCKPWAGVDVEDMSARVSRGERPTLPFEGTSLEGYDGFGDLVRLLWAQEPIARPAMEDVAQRLRLTEPGRAAATPAAEGSVTSTEAVLLGGDGGAQETSCDETGGGADPFRHADDTDQELLIPAVAGGSGVEPEVGVEREGEDEVGAEAEAGGGGAREEEVKEEEATERVGDDTPVRVAPPPSPPLPKTEKTSLSLGAADEAKLPACNDTSDNFVTPSIGNDGSGDGDGDIVAGGSRAVLDVPILEGDREAKVQVQDRELPVGADGDGNGPTSPQNESDSGKDGSAVKILRSNVVVALTKVLSSTRVADEVDENIGGGGDGTVRTQQAGAAAAVAAGAMANTSPAARGEEENNTRRVKSLPEVMKTVSTTWRDLMSEDGEADTDCDGREGVDSDVFFGAVSGARGSEDITDYTDGMSRRPWIAPRGGAGPIDLVTAGRDAFAVGARAAAGSSFPEMQPSPLTAKYPPPLSSSSPLGLADTPPHLYQKRIPGVDAERWAKRRSGGAAGMQNPSQAYVLSTEGSSRSDFESEEDGDEGYFSSSEKRSREVFTSPIVSTPASAKTIARAGKTETLPSFIPSPSIRPGSGYTTPKAGGPPTWAPSPPAHSGAIDSGLSYDSAMNARRVASTIHIRRAASSDQPRGTPQHRTRVVATGTSSVVESPRAGVGPTHVPSAIARPGEIGSGLAPAAAVTADVVVASAPLRRALSRDEPHSTSRRQACEAKAACVPSPASRPGGISSGLAPAATVNAGVVAASVPLRGPASSDRPRSTPLRRTGKVATGTIRVIETTKAGVVPARVRSPAARPGGIGSGLAPAAAATAGVVAASTRLRRAASSDEPRSTLRRQARKVAPDDGFVVDTRKPGVMPALSRHPPARFGRIGISLPPAEAGIAATSAAGAAAAPNPIRRTASSDQPHSARRRRTVKDATGTEHVFEAPKAKAMPLKVRSPAAYPGKISSGLSPASVVSPAVVVTSSTPLRGTISEDQPHDVVPQDQADKDVVSSLSGLLSPGLSQLSTTSRGGATVEVTPPASGGGRGKRRIMRGPAIGDTLVEAAVNRGVAPETPSRKGRAGAALRGLAMSLSRFGKTKRKDSSAGVESFSLEER